DRPRHTGANLPPLPLRGTRQPERPPQPAYPLAVHLPAALAYQRPREAVPVDGVFLSDPLQLAPELGVPRRHPAHVPQRRPPHLHQRTGPADARPTADGEVHLIAASLCAHHFFALISLRMSMSSVSWATTFLSRAFSDCSVRSSAAWLGSRPPKRLRQRNSVVGVTPCFLATCSTVTPSASD